MTKKTETKPPAPVIDAEAHEPTVSDRMNAVLAELKTQMSARNEEIARINAQFDGDSPYNKGTCSDEFWEMLKTGEIMPAGIEKALADGRIVMAVPESEYVKYRELSDIVVKLGDNLIALALTTRPKFEPATPRKPARHATGGTPSITDDDKKGMAARFYEKITPKARARFGISLTADGKISTRYSPEGTYYPIEIQRTLVRNGEVTSTQDALIALRQ